MKNKQLAACAGSIAAGMVLMTTVPAMALDQVRSWPRSGAGSIVSSDGGARAYGTWKVTDTSSGTRSIATANVRDENVGGDSGYVEMQTQSNSGICYAPEYTSCTQTWYFHASDQTNRTNSDRYVRLSASTNVDGGDQFTRARLKVCVDRRYKEDPCSGFVTTYGDKY